MAIQESKKQSDLEKRLNLLRRQVYGKNIEYKISPISDTKTDTTIYTSDVLYLKSDLIKILFLSSLALGIQLLLFFLSKNQVLNMSKLLLAQ